MGMVMAAELSVLSGALKPEDVERTKALIAGFSLPVAPPQAMQADDFYGADGAR